MTATDRTSDRIVDFPVRDVLGVPIHAASRSEVVDACDRTIASGEFLLVGVVNVAKLVRMKDEVLRSSVTDADLVVADGMGVVWASRLLQSPLPERVAGIDLFLDLLALAAQRDYSVYLFGAKQDVLDECTRRVREQNPGLVIAGSRNGYFDDSETGTIAEDIRASGADILFVGIPSPHKEVFLARYGRQLGVNVCHGVGGSFDVVAAKVKRAPALWQRFGLEWLYRLIQEPRRMWKRYLVTNSVFAWKLTVELFRRRAGRAPGPHV
jgi:N-acetylglucosaminyldiphosphoundecaprenol N-acetyl-beta-D-mannosaminyltransferase